MKQKVQTKESTPRILYLDTLRVVSMFAVMVLHLAATGHKTAPVGSAAWIICWCYDFLCRFAVPVFVMISGALFLDPSRAVTLEGLLKKHIPKLLIVFLVWSGGYAALQSAREEAVFSAGFFLSVAQKTITGHYHMWYLYMIVGLYLATPFLRPVAADRKLLKSFVVLAFALNYMPRLLTVVPVLGDVVSVVMEHMNLSVFAGYAGYYCLGYLLHSTEISKRNAALLTVCAATLMGAAGIVGLHTDLMTPLSQEKMPHVFLYSTAVFVLFKSNADRLSRSARVKSIVEKAADCSLGMYLLHPMVNFALNALGMNALTFHPLLCVPLCAALVCGISFAVIRLMQKCPILRNIV